MTPWEDISGFGQSQVGTWTTESQATAACGSHPGSWGAGG